MQVIFMAKIRIISKGYHVKLALLGVKTRFEWSTHTRLNKINPVWN